MLISHNETQPDRRFVIRRCGMLSLYHMNVLAVAEPTVTVSKEIYETD